MDFMIQIIIMATALPIDVEQVLVQSAKAHLEKLC